MKVVIFTDPPTNRELKEAAQRESVSDVAVLGERDRLTQIAIRELRRRIAVTPPVEDGGFDLATLFNPTSMAKP